MMHQPARSSSSSVTSRGRKARRRSAFMKGPWNEEGSSPRTKNFEYEIEPLSAPNRSAPLQFAYPRACRRATRGDHASLGLASQGFARSLAPPPRFCAGKHRRDDERGERGLFATRFGKAASASARRGGALARGRSADADGD